mmetsp:Transcript_26271/g.57781  ORF Transcript_26271/g.57781 Transcript_26271/m.57781 type:complete len:83 (+) Transcript_26271:327-575(+)
MHVPFTKRETAEQHVMIVIMHDAKQSRHPYRHFVQPFGSGGATSWPWPSAAIMSECLCEATAMVSAARCRYIAMRRGPLTDT